MTKQKTDLTVDEFLNFDIEGYYAAKALRKDRPWVYDIIRVLWGRSSGRPLKDLYRELWEMRNSGGLPMPKSFQETIRRSIYDHSSDAADWNGKAENDLFYSPKRGVWAVRGHLIRGWLGEHDLPNT